MQKCFSLGYNTSMSFVEDFHFASFGYTIVAILLLLVLIFGLKSSSQTQKRFIVFVYWTDIEKYIQK